MRVDGSRSEPVRSGARDARFLTPEPGAEDREKGLQGSRQKKRGQEGLSPWTPLASLQASIVSQQAGQVETAMEGLFLMLEEFCSLADMIRSDTSQILEENLPLLKAKAVEIRGVYARVDRLEAFVKMVGRHAAFLEALVVQAEQQHGALPQALQRWLCSVGVPAFQSRLPVPACADYELPELYRTEDFFFPEDPADREPPSL